MKNIIKVLVLMILLIIGLFAVRVLTRSEEVQGNITFNFQALKQYESLYVGDMSNTTQLFDDLLLSEKNKSFRMFPEIFKVTIYYDEEVEKADDKILRKAVVYNSLMGFSLIKNLQVIEYDFGYEKYVVNRSEAESWIDFELDGFYDNKIDSDVLMAKIGHEEFIETCLEYHTNEKENQSKMSFDLLALSKYESLDLGDIKNTEELFNELLLSEISKSFRVYPDLYVVSINFDDSIEKTDDKLIGKALVYNSLIGFSLIKNLQTIEYDFPNKKYTISRSEAESWFDFQLDGFYNNEVDSDLLMTKINQEAFIESCLKNQINDGIDEQTDDSAVSDKTYFPLVVGNYMLGVYDKNKWFKASDVLEDIVDLKSYKLYDLEGLMGRGVTEAVTNYTDELTRTDMFMNGDPLSTDFIGSNSDWNLMPRIATMQSLTSDTYVDIVKELLEENGITDDIEIIITQNIKIDLEGDGVDEVIIVAENLDYRNSYLDKNDYSMIVIRKIINGEVKNLFLVNDFVASDIESKENITINHEIVGLIDSDGDGNLEIIMTSDSMDGKAYSLYKLIDNNIIEQLYLFLELTVIFN